jgi:diguanylate cyclase (GGDEF)-like protein
MALRSYRLIVMTRDPAELTQIRMKLAGRAEARFECRRLDSMDALEKAVSGRPSNADAILVWIDAPSEEEEIILRRIAGSSLHPVILGSDVGDAGAVIRWAAAGIDFCLPRTGLTPEMLSNALLIGIARSHRAARIGYDELTGLPTRALWQDRLAHALRRCARNHTLGAMMLIDIDDFKQVNDMMGHDVGDALLVEIAQRLRSVVRSRDTVARFGGDEFAVLLEDLTYPEAALRVARKILRAIADPIALPRATLKCSVSIGIAILSADQPDIDSEWAHQASDIALYDAKQQGKNRFSLFTADMDRALLHSLELDSNLVEAVETDEFVLHYQPLVDVESGRLDGFEALLRWQRSSGEIVLPASFLPALERLGMMDRVGRLLFATAIRQIGLWRERTGMNLTMHVNLAATQIIDQQFSNMVLAEIESARIPGAAIIIELTETVAFRYGVLIEREFARLRRHGVRFAIDDFGTGYNSMTYLKQFRPDMVKIDRSFIATMDRSPVDAAIVRAQSVLAASLDIRVVAEGVETPGQLAALRAMGDVHMVQGFLTGRPMAAADLERDYAPLHDRLDMARPV